jgi:hypothetical protein
LDAFLRFLHGLSSSGNRKDQEAAAWGVVILWESRGNFLSHEQIEIIGNLIGSAIQSQNVPVLRPVLRNSDVVDSFLTLDPDLLGPVVGMLDLSFQNEPLQEDASVACVSICQNFSPDLFAAFLRMLMENGFPQVFSEIVIATLRGINGNSAAVARAGLAKELMFHFAPSLMESCADIFISLAEEAISVTNSAEIGSRFLSFFESDISRPETVTTVFISAVSVENWELAGAALEVILGHLRDVTEESVRRIANEFQCLPVPVLEALVFPKIDWLAEPFSQAGSSEATVALALAATELFLRVPGAGVTDEFWNVLSQVTRGLGKVESEDIQGRVPDDLEALVANTVEITLRATDECPAERVGDLAEIVNGLFSFGKEHMILCSEFLPEIFAACRSKFGDEFFGAFDDHEFLGWCDESSGLYSE